MAGTAQRTQSSVQWLSDEAARAAFDAEARRVLGISGAEFLRRYDAGEFAGHPDTSDEADLDFWGLVMMIPIGR